MKSNAESYRKCNSEIGIQESKVNNVQSVIMYSSTIQGSRISQSGFEIHYSQFGIQKSGSKNRQPSRKSKIAVHYTVHYLNAVKIRSQDLEFIIYDSGFNTRHHAIPMSSHSNRYRFIIAVINDFNSLQNMPSVFWNSNMSNTTSVPWNSLNHYYLLFSQKFVHYH